MARSLFVSTRRDSNNANFVNNCKQQPQPLLLTVWLDIRRLRIFLLETLPQYCCIENNDLIQIAQERYHSIYSKIMIAAQELKNRQTRNTNFNKTDNGNWSTTTSQNTRTDPFKICRDDLYDCISILTDFLSITTTSTKSQEVPMNVLIETHYMMGLIYETLNQMKQASQSYIKALWLIKSTTTTSRSGSSSLDFKPTVAEVIYSTKTPIELVGTTLHCLGRAYGSLKLYRDATCILLNAEYQYQSMNISRDHEVIINIRALIESYSNAANEVADSSSLQLDAGYRRNNWCSTTNKSFNKSWSSSLTMLDEEFTEQS